LQRTDYYVAAAVIAGTVLETALRDLCQRNQEGLGTLDRMNAELAKKGVYVGLQRVAVRVRVGGR
jgi:hypothetical protein